MQKFTTILFTCFFFASTFGQTEKKISAFLLTQYNKTLYDYTIGNNPWGVGLGLQTFFNNRSRFKPTLEFTGDIYLEDNKVLRTDPGGTGPNSSNDVRGMINLFAGSSFHPTQKIYFSVIAGPSFINRQTYLGIKPSFGFIFQRLKDGQENYLVSIFLIVQR